MLEMPNLHSGKKFGTLEKGKRKKEKLHIAVLRISSFTRDQKIVAAEDYFWQLEIVPGKTNTDHCVLLEI